MFKFFLHLMKVHNDVTTTCTPQQPLEGGNFPRMNHAGHKAQPDVLPVLCQSHRLERHQRGLWRINTCTHEPDWCRTWMYCDSKVQFLPVRLWVNVSALKPLCTDTAEYTETADCLCSWTPAHVWNHKLTAIKNYFCNAYLINNTTVDALTGK